MKTTSSTSSPSQVRDFTHDYVICSDPNLAPLFSVGESVIISSQDARYIALAIGFVDGQSSRAIKIAIDR